MEQLAESVTGRSYFEAEKQKEGRDRQRVRNGALSGYPRYKPSGNRGLHRPVRACESGNKQEESVDEPDGYGLWGRFSYTERL